MVGPDTVSCMARIPLRDSTDPELDPVARRILDKVVFAGDQSIEPNVYRAMANHPQALQAIARFGTVVYADNSMTPTQRELAYLTASVVNECHY